jgi:hypothetical protein
MSELASSAVESKQGVKWPLSAFYPELEWMRRNTSVVRDTWAGLARLSINIWEPNHRVCSSAWCDVDAWEALPVGLLPNSVHVYQKSGPLG